MNEMLKILDGKRNVLLSAPHIFQHPRKTLEGLKINQAETYTEDILKDVCSRTESYGITLSEETDFDPNFEKYYQNPYKRAVKNLIKNFKIDYFVDLHGLGNHHNFDIGIYYRNKFSNSKKLAFHFAKELNSGVFKDSLINIILLKDNEQETLTEYVCKALEIPAIQIEVAQYIAEDEFLRNEFSKKLSEIISSLF